MSSLDAPSPASPSTKSWKAPSTRIAMAKKTASAPAAARPAPSPPINWPTITAEPDLELERLSPDLIVVDGFFSRQTLKTWRTFLPTISMSPPAPAQKGYAPRFNDRFGCQAPDFARDLYEKSGLRELCEGGIESGVKGKRPVGLNPNIRMYKYEEGAYFGRQCARLCPPFAELTSLASSTL